jgi:hypothetical protein
MKVVATQPKAPSLRVAPKAAAADGLVLNAAKADDMLALSSRAARRFASDANGDGRIDDAEAKAYTKAAQLPQAPGFLAKLLDSLGLKKLPAPSTQIVLDPAKGSPDLAVARRAQRYMETQLGAAKADALDWAGVAIDRRAADTRVTVKSADGQDVHTLVVTPNPAKPGSYTIQTQLEAAMGQAKATLKEEYQQQVAEAMVKDLAARAQTGWAPDLDWKTYHRVAAPMDSDVSAVTSTAGKTYRFLEVWGEGEADKLHVQPAQILDMYSSGIDDPTQQMAAEAIFNALKPEGPDGWPPSVDWKTLSLKDGQATVKEQGTDRVFSFSFKVAGQGDDMHVEVAPIK